MKQPCPEQRRRKNATVALVGLGAATAAILLIATTGQAAPPMQVTVEMIMASATIDELNVYYNAAAALYVHDEIDEEYYQELYAAYVTRFYQLAGG